MKNILLKPVIVIPSLLLLISSVLVFSLLNNNTDDREEYEEFLLGESSRIMDDVTELEGLPKPGQPEMAAVQNYFMTLDPVEKRVPLERLKTGYKLTKERENDLRLKSTASTLDWNIVSSNMGGRVRVIEYDPNYPNDDRVWAGSVTGGLWINEDLTNNLSGWSPVDDFWPSLAISSIAFDPLDPLIMYVGTGEAFTSTTIYRESSGLGVGIFKSYDNGDTWELIPSTEDFKYVTDIEIRNENGVSVIYAGVVSGVYKGVNHQSEPSDGLYRSTDGGDTWLQVLPYIPGTNTPYSPADIEIASNGRIFVGTKRNLNDEGGATILYSDSGVIGSWTIFDDYVSIIQSDPDYYVPGRVMLAPAPSDPDVVYALFGAGYVSSSNGFTYSRGRHIARTNNGGATWNYRPYPTGGDYYWATLAWHALTAEVDPNDPDHVWIGGLDVYKSEDGGNDWDQVSDWRGMYSGGGEDYVHADIHDIDFRFGSSDELIISTDGGVFYTDQATNNYPDFQQKNLSFGSLQFYTCDLSPTAGNNTFVGGLQDNGTLYYTGSPLTIFDMIGGGDGAYCFIDDDNPDYMYISVYYNQYTVFVNGSPYDYLYDWSSGIFINPVDLDDDDDVMFANACSFGGTYADWILKLDGLPFNGYGDYINLGTGTTVWFSHIKYSSYSPPGSTNLFVGTLSGNLFKVTEAESDSPQVEDITGGDFPEANLSSVSIGGSEDTLLVTFSNYGVSSVWYTTDGGQNWEEKESDLPDIPVRWSLFHPDNSNHVMLATETGIWTTNGIHQPTVLWTPDNEGLANVRVDMLQMRESDYTVLAATHGRGLAYTTWDITTGMTDEISKAGFKVYPNPSNGLVNVETEDSQKIESIRVYNLAGQLIEQLEFNSNINGSYQLDLRQMPAGKYVVKIVSGPDTYSQKILINK